MLYICPIANECPPDKMREYSECFAREPHYTPLRPSDGSCPACVPYKERERYEEYKPHKCTQITEEGCFCIHCGTKTDLVSGNASDKCCPVDNRGIKH